MHGDGSRGYVFVFYGDAPLDDWDVDTLLSTALGEEEGQRRMQEWVDLIDGEQTSVYVAG